MAWHLNFSPVAAQYSLLIEQKGRAFYPHVFATVHRFLNPNTEQIAGGAVGIGRERQLQSILDLELGMAFETVAGDADHPRVESFKLGAQC